MTGPRRGRPGAAAHSGGRVARHGTGPGRRRRVLPRLSATSLTSFTDRPGPPRAGPAGGSAARSGYAASVAAISRGAVTYVDHGTVDPVSRVGPDQNRFAQIDGSAGPGNVGLRRARIGFSVAFCLLFTGVLYQLAVMLVLLAGTVLAAVVGPVGFGRAEGGGLVNLPQLMPFGTPQFNPLAAPPLTFIRAATRALGSLPVLVSGCTTARRISAPASKAPSARSPPPCSTSCSTTPGRAPPTAWPPHVRKATDDRALPRTPLFPQSTPPRP